MSTTESVDGVERVQLAAQVYVYGYPLVYNLHEIDGFANNIASIPFSAPYNQFGYARELLGPETEFVSPNNDTLYVVAACDVRQGPLVLHVLTQAAATTCSSSSTLGLTISPTSGAARRGRARASSCSRATVGLERFRPACGLFRRLPGSS